MQGVTRWAGGRRVEWSSRRSALGAWIGLPALLLAFVLLMALAAPAQAQQRGLAVSSVQGVLRTAVGQPFTTFLIDDNGRTFGLFGETPTLDRQIIQFRDQGTRVQLDGTLFPGGLVSTMDEIAVQRIVAVGTQPPQPTPVPPSQPTGVVNSPSVNVRSGPSTAFPAVGQATQGTTCTLTGRNGDLTWLQASCPGAQGWISASLLIVRGDVTRLPVIATPDIPTPVPPAFPNWKASYFNNPTLSGSAIVIRNEPAINFRWGFASPDTRIPVDNFSGRFESVQSQAAGLYDISVIVDDGVRVWVDNQLIIDDWRVGSERRLVVQRQLGSQASVRIEYFEASEQATLVFNITRSTGPVTPPTPTPVPGVAEVAPGQGNWGYAHWNNISLSGAPAVSAYWANPSGVGIQANWGLGSPSPAVNADNFSSRFRGRFYFNAGDHTFTATADDGIRVRIDGITILDDWRDGQSTVSNRFYNIGEGWHLIEVEYYERGGVAFLDVRWSRDTGGGGGGGGGGSRDPVRDE